MRFLSKIEHLVHLDLTYFLSGGFWLSVGQLGALLLSFISALVFARYISAETYGIYRYLSSAITILSLFSLTGLGTALTQAVASGKEGTLRTAFTTQLRWSSLMSVICFGLSLYAVWQHNTVFFVTFIVFAISGPLYFASGLYDSYLSGKGKFRLMTVFNLLFNTVASLYLIAAAFTGRFFLFLFPFQFALQTIFGLIIYRRLEKTIPDKAPIDTKADSYGKRLSLIYILAAIADQADNIILFLFAGPVNLAVYAFAMAIPEVIKGFLKTINPLALPKLTKTDPSIFRRSLPARLFQILLVAGVVISVYNLIAPYVFTLFFPAYKSSILFSQIFALSLLSTPFYLVNAYFQANKMVKPIFLVNTLSPVIQIILMAIFTFYYGLPGLVVSRVLGRMLNMVFSVVLVYL